MCLFHPLHKIILTQITQLQTGSPQTTYFACLLTHREIWFGSSAGLTKYDGSAMFTYTTTDGLPSNNVKKLFEMQNGNILIATINGISIFDGNTFTNYLSGISINAVFESSTNEIWAGSNGNAHRFDGFSWFTYNSGNGLPHNFVYSFTEDMVGNIWAGTADGVGRFDIPGWTPFTNLNGSNDKSDFIISASCDMNGVLWFGSQPPVFGEGGGVNSYDGTTWTHFNITEGLGGRKVTAIVTDCFNNKWFSNNNGNSYYNDISYPLSYAFTNFSTAGGLINNIVNDASIDTDGCIWFATFGGVSKLTPLSINNVSYTHAACNTNFEGSITINAGSINTPLLYSVDGGINMQTGNTFNALPPGVYIVMATDSCASVVLAPDTIYLLQPILPQLPDTLQICKNDSIQIFANSNGSNYNWHPSDYISQNYIYNPYFFPPGSQYIYLSMDDENGCAVEDSTYITVFELSNMEIIIDDSVFICVGDFISYVWYHYSNVISGATDSIYIALAPGIYTVEATNSNGCITVSEMIHYNNPGYEEYSDIFELSIFQDREFIIIDLKTKEKNLHNCKIVLYNIHGKTTGLATLFQYSQNKYRALLHTNHILSGMYIIHIEGTGISRKISIY